MQWAGPWTKPGVPMRVRYRHTHWIATAETEHDGLAVFDVNAICAGGWIAFDEWQSQLVPWLLGRMEPRADGRWWPTHLLELDAVQCRIAAEKIRQGVLSR